MGNPFQKAIKFEMKLRLAICGPAGSGKTFTALKVATALGGPIAYVCTEHGSARKYSDMFSFDVVEPDRFDPHDLIEFIDLAVQHKYNVICIDSLSHYWMGPGGELDMVDAAARKIQGNSFAAWKNVTPVHNKLVDKLISAKIHVICGIRTKTEWVLEKDDRGKTTPRKIGLAPIMRDGIEFEFDVCGDMDQDHTFTVTKSRCSALADQVIQKPGREMAETLLSWLSGAPTPPPPPQQNQRTSAPPSSPTASTNGGGAHTSAPATEPQGPQEDPEVQALFEACKKPNKDTGKLQWDKFAFVAVAHDIKRDIEDLCGAANPYYEVLGGFKNAKGEPLTGFGPADIESISTDSKRRVNVACAVIKALHLKKKLIEASTFADQGAAPAEQADEAKTNDDAAAAAAAWAEEANNV